MRGMATGLSLLAALCGCRAATSEPEDGAVLLSVSCTPEAPAADELHAWVYDDDGALWSGSRIEGAQPVDCKPGTVLLQPGAFRGKLRVHLRAFAAGTRVMDGVLSVASLDGSRTFAIVLDPALPADADGDDVPDVIDDCPGVPNPLQGGCHVVDAAGRDATDSRKNDAGLDMPAFDLGSPDVPLDVPADVPVDTARIDAEDDASSIGLAQGDPCSDSSECASGFCADGVCCTNACAGPCRSCNQPSSVGMCQGYAADSDPEGECAAGLACNGVGACGPESPGNRSNGQLCTADTQCASGYCTDGVCCDSLCAGACQACGGGTCVAVLRADDVPECTGTLTCNSKGRCVAK